MVRRTLIVCAFLAVISGGLWLGREPILDRLKGWRSQHLLTRSETAREEGERAVAHQLARAAWQLQPGELPYLRRLLEHSRDLNAAHLPALSVAVFLHPEAKAADQHELLRWALVRGDTPFFWRLHQSLDEERRQAPEVRLLSAEALGREGRLLEAVEEARALESQPGTGTEASLLLTALLPRLPKNELAWNQARTRIRDLLQAPEASVALRAFRNLRLLPVTHRDLGPDFEPRTWVEEQAERMAEDRLLAHQIALARLPDSERNAALDALEDEFRAEPETRSLLVRWYLETGQLDRLLRLDPETLRSDARLYASRLQALIDRERMEEAEAWLEEAPPNIPQLLVTCLEAGFAERAGRESEAVSRWQEALAQAESLASFRDGLTILRIAAKFEAEKVVRQAVDILTGLPSHRLPASPGLAVLEGYFVERPEDWLKFWRGLARNRPGDGFAAEQVVFLESFLDESTDPAEGCRRAAGLVERYPGLLRFRTTQALWMLRDGRAEEAVRLLQQAPVNWKATSDADRAVFALAQWRAGHVRDGSRLERGIRWEAISPVRRNLLAAMPKQAEVAASSDP